MRILTQDCCTLKKLGRVCHMEMNSTPTSLFILQKIWRIKWFSQFAEQLVWGTIFSSTTELRASIHLWRVKSKNASSPGKPSKYSYGEFVNIADGFVSRYRRNVHRVVVGDGPYKLAPKYQHAAATEDSWRKMSQKERAAKISAIDPVGSKKLPVDVLGKTSATTSTVTKPPRWNLQFLPLITLVFLQWRAFQTLKSVAYQNICGAPCWFQTNMWLWEI